MTEVKKMRLDRMLQLRHPDLSRAALVQLIEQGQVTVNGQIIVKPGGLVSFDSEVVLKMTSLPYVSRAGQKLEFALQHFGINVANLVALDAGLSTGGFADCLLQHGISKIYGVDVGYGQTHSKVAGDARLIILERTNLRYLNTLPELVDLVTLDLSFISILKVIGAVNQLIRPGGKLIALIKPQFEVGVELVGRSGIVRNTNDAQAAVQQVIAGIESAGFKFQAVAPSPIKGGDGNQEFLAWFIKTS